MTLTATQGRALVQLIAALRRDWQPAGIEAAIRKATADGATGPDVCVAAVRAAVDRDARTPGVIPAPGPHWQALRSGTRQAPIECPEHPGQPSGRCRPCADQRATPDQIRAARAMAAELMSRPSTEGDDQ